MDSVYSLKADKENCGGIAESRGVNKGDTLGLRKS